MLQTFAHAGCVAGIGCLELDFSIGAFDGFGAPGHEYYGTAIFVHTLRADFTSPATAVMAASNRFGPDPCGFPGNDYPFEIPLSDRRGCINAFHIGPTNLQSYTQQFDFLPFELLPVLSAQYFPVDTRVNIYTPIPGVVIPPGTTDVRPYANVQTVTLRALDTPEPATLALVASGGLALAMARRRARGRR